MAPRIGALAPAAAAAVLRGGPAVWWVSWCPWPLASASLQPPHKVNLTAPTTVILVNLLKATCGVAVVDSFRELQKYNIRALTEPPPEEEQDGKAEGKAAGKEEGKEAEEEGGSGSGAAAAEAAEGAPAVAEAGAEAAAEPATEAEPAVEEGGSVAAAGLDGGEPVAAP